jgi:predicted nucleic acid-binding protein
VRSGLIGKVVNLIRERAEEVKVRSLLQMSPDPKGDVFCVFANEGEADLIVTLNPKDFPQTNLRANVVSPSEFNG